MTGTAKKVGARGKQRNRFGRGRGRPDVPDNPFGERVQQWILWHSLEHLHGPREVQYGPDEFVVLVQLYNGEPYVKPLLEHYFSLGAKHVVFLDNGSTDGCVEILKGYDDVTVFRTGRPYKTYNVAIKRHLIERFGRGRWTLSVDQDELFDYPFSDVVSLKALLRYLSEHSYTAVVAYMLDMFPERLFEDDSATRDVSLEELKKTNRFYEISEVTRANYHDVGEIGNVLSNEEVGVLRGGVRERLFGVRPMLTKHPLVFYDDELRPMDQSDHWAGNARVADFTGILLHYKLTNSLYGVVRQEIRDRRQLDLQKDRYGEYFKVLDKSPSLLLKSGSSRELKSVNDLVGTPFATVSRQYMGFVEGEERGQDQHSAGISSERMYEPFFNALAESAAHRAAAREARQESERMYEPFFNALAESAAHRAAAREARQEAREGHEQARAERQKAREAREKAQRAEEQIRAIQASRSWRILTGLGRIKNVLRGTISRLKGGSASGGRG